VTVGGGRRRVSGELARSGRRRRAAARRRRVHRRRTRRRHAPLADYHRRRQSAQRTHAYTTHSNITPIQFQSHSWATSLMSSGSTVPIIRVRTYGRAIKKTFKPTTLRAISDHCSIRVYNSCLEAREDALKRTYCHTQNSCERCRAYKLV
jgi:hypothetical protein